VAKVKRGVSVDVIILAMVILIAVSCSALAARPVPAGSESSGITVRTSAHVDGDFLSHTDLALQQGTSGDQISTIVYSEDTNAINGKTDYSKDTNIDTGNVVNGQNNVQITRDISYDGGDGGIMHSDENVIVQTVGTEEISAAGCCPWGVTTDATSPAECETVQAGSTMDVTEVSASSSTGVRAIADAPGTTVSLDYSIDAHGINQTTPGDTANGAIGSASAYVDASGVAANGNSTTPGSDISYHDVTSVDGLFDLSKDISYSSAPN
jgi:hypothetical protein